MRLTDRAITTLALPKGKTEAIIFDDDVPGFGVRLRAAGNARWVFQYKIGSQQRRVTLGAVKALSAVKARATAADLHAKVRLGFDPAGRKLEDRARAAETFGAMLVTYLAHKRATVRPGSYTGIERHLERHARRLHGTRVDQIDRRAIAGLLTAVTAASGPIEANRVRASLSAFFAWAMREGLADKNPVTGTGRQPERSRERVLADAELKAIWAATAGGDDYSAIVRLLMLTGCRAAEIAALSWSEIFGDRIVLPEAQTKNEPARTKNGRGFILPLSDAAQAIIEARPRDGDRDFVFGRRDDRPFSGWSVCKDLLDARIKDNGATVERWTPHDLRRTCATRMAELGVQPHIIEAVLNHVSGHKAGVAGIYNRATYEPEKRQALMLWADHLLSVVEGRRRKVVSFTRK
jgi:integrase